MTPTAIAIANLSEGLIITLLIAAMSIPCIFLIDITASLLIKGTTRLWLDLKRRIYDDRDTEKKGE